MLATGALPLAPGPLPPTPQTPHRYVASCALFEGWTKLTSGVNQAPGLNQLALHLISLLLWVAILLLHHLQDRSGAPLGGH